MAEADRPELIVTNFNRDFTGVSATAASVTRNLASRYHLALCGVALAGLPQPVGRLEALSLSRRAPATRPFVIWHVRRNSEMQVALIARDILRRPVRIVFTSSAQRRHSAWPRFLISRMDAVIATSAEAARLVPNTTAVIPHGVDTDLFRPAVDRAALWAKTGFPGKRGIVSLGRIRPEKGADLFVRAMIDVLPRFPDATAVLVGKAKPGDTEFRGRLKAEIAAAGLEKRIVFTGELPQKRLASMLPAFSLLVAAPRYEGFGLTPLEAMSSGVPFVATDTGAFRDFSDGGRAGEIVPVDDLGALSRAVDAWLRQPERTRIGGAAARAVVQRNYAASREADAVADVYEALWKAG